MTDHPLLLAILVTFGATGLGALPALFLKNISDQRRDFLLGMSGGVMLAATCFSLILPAVSRAESRGFPPLTSASLVALMLLGGAAVIHLINEFTPHEHFYQGREGANAKQLKRIWLFILAITIHNIPEGLAVGVTAGTGDPAIALPILIGIGFQDIPEGLVVALALLANGYRMKDAIFVSLITGVVEAMGAAVGYGFVQITESVLPWTLAASGGMML
ncbi:MAG: ZIP family metal transporter, partial [Proteobacteria bacterium]